VVPHVVRRARPITERGTHAELVEASDRYADPWAVQAGDLDSLLEGSRRRVRSDDD
jgi:hypothetical protein